MQRVRIKNRRAPLQLLERLESRVFLTALPTISVTLGKSPATELNGATTGAGTFIFKRTGPTTAPLTVQYTVDAASTAHIGTDFTASLTGTILFNTGASTATLTINPIDTPLADGPKTVILNLATGTAPIYNISSHQKATLPILDHAPTITLAATHAASEINGTTTGAGLFTFKRTGPTTAPLTVHFAVGGSATETTDYTTLSSHTVTFDAGKATATLAINPIDDVAKEGTEKVTLTLAADGATSSYHFKTTPASVSIADDTRPIFYGTIAPIDGAVKNTPFTITHDALLAATGVRDLSGGPITFKITAIKGGTLQKNSAAALINKTTVSSGEMLSWTPPTDSLGTLAAFSVTASDGKHVTKAVTLSVAVAAPSASVVHPVLQVLPAALDQPQINAVFYVGNSSTPQVGQSSTLDPDTLENATFNTFNVSAYLDTGASSILISNPTNTILNLPLLQSNGTPVIYSDVGVAGSDDFQVSGNIRLSLAGSYQRTDLDQFSDAAQTQPITTPYTPIPGAHSTLRVEVGPFVPTVDNPVTDEFSSLINDLGAIDVIGMPSMVGRVTVIDPTRVNSFGTVLDALLADPANLDLSALDADMSVHSFIYAPGTPFHPNTTATDPGIPATDMHVKLSYGSFDRFTQVTPAGQPGPTLEHNPFIGEDPVAVLDGTPHASVPGIKITRTITVPAQGGGTTQQTLSSEGNWLLDTGAAASIISKAQAAKLDVTYAPGTFGTDSPVLVDQDGNPLPNQFTLGIGGIGGQETLAGFYLDSLLVRTQEGNPANDNDPNHLLFTQEPVLVGDVTVKDPSNGQTLTLDGIFGMNNLIASADFSLDSTGGINDFNAATGNFNWITFDEPNGVLGLSFDPAALAASAAATPHAAVAGQTLLSHSALTPAISTGTFADISLAEAPTLPLASPVTPLQPVATSTLSPIETPITVTPQLITLQTPVTVPLNTPVIAPHVINDAPLNSPPKGSGPSSIAADSLITLAL